MRLTAGNFMFVFRRKEINQMIKKKKKNYGIRKVLTPSFCPALILQRRGWRTGD